MSSCLILSYLTLSSLLYILIPISSFSTALILVFSISSTTPPPSPSAFSLSRQQSSSPSPLHLHSGLWGTEGDAPMYRFDRPFLSALRHADLTVYSYGAPRTGSSNFCKVQYSKDRYSIVAVKSPSYAIMTCMAQDGTVQCLCCILLMKCYAP